jgi:SAM-dependent methyltransferase
MFALDTNDIYNCSPPPHDHVATIRASGAQPDPPKKPSYGLDSPMGLVLSNIASPLYLYASLKGKGDFWDNVIENLSPEQTAGPVLDVGCGRGLVLLKLAQRKKALSATAPAYGIDIFNSADQTGNSPTATYANAACLGLLDHVVLHTANFIRDLPFKDGAFGVITASLSLHNVSATERQSAIDEMIRICAPGGCMIVLDLMGYVSGCRDSLARHGWTDVSLEFGGAKVMFGIWPCQLLKARKPLVETLPSEVTSLQINRS